jgi:hypothetical protein
MKFFPDSGVSEETPVFNARHEEKTGMGWFGYL